MNFLQSSWSPGTELQTHVHQETPVLLALESRLTREGEACILVSWGLNSEQGRQHICHFRQIKAIFTVVEK